MSETTTTEEVKPVAAETTTPNAAADPGNADIKKSKSRYIPFSGGSMGWYENGGVLKRELKNNYGFKDAIDKNAFRQALFNRWNSGEASTRRVEHRSSIERQLILEIGGKEYEAKTLDISLHGVRAQLEGDVELKKGEEIKVTVLEETGSKNPKLSSLTALTMWVMQVGKRRKLMNLGFGFTSLTEEQEREMKLVLLD